MSIESSIYSGYIVACLYCVILTGLDGIQDNLEDPFNGIGVDDIHLTEHPKHLSQPILTPEYNELYIAKGSNNSMEYIVRNVNTVLGNNKNIAIDSHLSNYTIDHFDIDYNESPVPVSTEGYTHREAFRTMSEKNHRNILGIPKLSNIASRLYGKSSSLMKWFTRSRNYKVDNSIIPNEDKVLPSSD